MPRPPSNRQMGTPTGAWNQYYEADGPGGAGFTDGILKLNKVFEGNVLEALALGYIDPDDQDVYASMFQRGIRQLQHPDMKDKYKKVLEGGDGINPTELPFYLQLTLGLIAASNSVNGRAHQRRVDMHTQWNSAAVLGRIASAGLMMPPADVVRAGEGYNQEPAQRRNQDQGGQR